MIRLISWNVNGIRASIKKGLWQKIDELKPDIFCLQETKADANIMASPDVFHPKYKMCFHSASSRRGYSGVATYSKVLKNSSDSSDSNVLDDLLEDGFVDSKFAENHDDSDDSEASQNPENPENQILLDQQKIGIDDEEFDVEGRLVSTEYQVPNSPVGSFVLLNGYFPQGGRGPERIEYKIRFYEKVKKLAQSYLLKGRHVIICGDLNTTVADIDLARPAQNRKTTGCLPEEREALNWFLKEDFVDAFRHFYPDKPDCYSYWDQITRARERNVGWRIDYFLVSKSLLPYVLNSQIHDQVFGSDHAPVSLDLM